MHRPRRSFPLPAVVCLALAGAALPLAAQPEEKHPAIRKITTAEFAGWLCKALPANDGRKLASTLFDGKVPGESDAGSWFALVVGDGKDLIDVNFMGMELVKDVSAYVLTVEMEGDWHGISEADWVALARRIPGEVVKSDTRAAGHKICGKDKKGGCEHRGGYEARPGVRWIQIVWSGSDPNPSQWFCAKG
jgi:hypothetical protein